MLEALADSLGIPVAAAVGLVVLVCVQLALQAVALVHLARRTGEARPPRWVWTIIVLIGGLLGAVAYLAFGRTPETPGTTTSSSRDRDGALDRVFGRRVDR